MNRELSWEQIIHHLEFNQSSGSLYLSKVTGGSISESESHQVLSRYGALEKVWYCSQTEKEMFRLPEGIWIMFAFFQDCRDAQAVRSPLGDVRRSSQNQGFRDDVKYRLEQPRMPDDRFGNHSFQPLPILRSKPSIKPQLNKVNNQREIDLCSSSIFVGNIPLQAREQSLKKIFGTYGQICRVELIKKSSVHGRFLVRFFRMYIWLTSRQRIK